MLITARTPLVGAPVSKPSPDPNPPKVPQQPRDVLGSLLMGARDAAVRALVATTATSRFDPTRPAATQDAQVALGRAIGMVDAAEAVSLLVPEALYNSIVLRMGLENASGIIAAAIKASPSGITSEAAEQARVQIKQALYQMDYVITKFWPAA